MTKRFALALVALTLALTGMPAADAQAQPAVYCAVPPVPPVGCTNQHAQCLCDSSGHCRWVYDCSRN
jgi:hypothetical protein